MRTALLAATALVALSSMAVAQDQLVASEPAPKGNMPKVRTNDSSVPRLHYDVPCRVSAEGTCTTEPQYRPLRPVPKE